MKLLLSGTYWPNIETIYHALRAEEIVLEAREHFVKQSFRNRCEILSANGVLRLSVPVKKSLPGTPVKEIEISYRSKWQKEHWRALCSAYNNSPFFEYFKDELAYFYESEEKFLLSYNLQLIEFVFKILRVKKNITFTENYDPSPSGVVDLRELADSKNGRKILKQDAPVLLRPYYQTFGSKFGFIQNLSILDLLFNEGLPTRDHLTEGR